MLFLSGGLSFVVSSALTPVASVGFWRVAVVDEFAFGAVGCAGTTSTGERLYHSVASSPLSPSAFRMLYRFGNPHAEAYALVGLREVDPDSYEKLLGDFRSSSMMIA